MATKQQTTPFFKRAWVSAIGVFILSQLFFFSCEIIGWAPNYRELDSELLRKILDSALFKEWLSFYEIPYFNLLTLFFTITCLIPGIIGAIRQIFAGKSYN